VIERATQEWAQRCAALIVESGLTDWKLARRKSANGLGVAPHTPEPSDTHIIAAIREYNALYQPNEHRAQIRAQREEALSWMEYFTEFSPKLTGAVAEGWAHAESEIRIELVVSDEKTFEIKLVNDDVRFHALESTYGATHYAIEDADWPLRVMLLSDRTRGQAKWNAASPRLSIKEVAALVE
jgi:hypothetical protein